MDVGVQFNQYLIVEHIGRGGMADVWSARDQRLNRMVAIKTIAHGLSADANPVQMFKQEAQTIAQMEHPHILPIYDFGEYEGQLYIVMRYVSGGALEGLLRRGPVPIPDALRLGQAVAQALDYAHSRKIVHLDLKPPNILLDSQSSPYLADFGLATVLDAAGKARNPGSGTLLYMAPEQLTSDVIDYRADHYSFALVMFHMLTGELPFEASAPLALRQMQFNDNLPELHTINDSIPAPFTDILRRATAVDPTNRYETLSEMIDEMREVLVDTAGFYLTTSDATPYAVPPGADADLLEAIDIYNRSYHHWDHGNGRFLLGVTNFMFMNTFYREAERHNLEIDRIGQQMLLRGALEYDHDLAYWWSQLDDDNRRWVCLHALRSGNAPARVRALYRLETLPDAPNDKMQIPKLVAQALQVETEPAAKLAALKVLGTRAHLVKPQLAYDIKTEYRGRLLTTLTRQGIQTSVPDIWLEVVYSSEIDTLIAQQALDEAQPDVAEFAARVIGQVRSKTAVRHLQKSPVIKALRALAYIRDEAPSLPEFVNWRGRVYAWGINTIRRMVEHPTALFMRFIAAVLVGWLAMGHHIYMTYSSFALFEQQRIVNAVGIGLVFGVVFGLVVIVADELMARLVGFWKWWARLLWILTFGVFTAMVAYWVYPWMLLDVSLPANMLLFGALGMMLSIGLVNILRLRSYVAIPLTAVFTYFPIYATYVMGWMQTEEQFEMWNRAPWPFPSIESFSLSLILGDNIYRPFMLLLALMGLTVGMSLGRWMRLNWMVIGGLSLVGALLLPYFAYLVRWVPVSPIKDVWPLTDLANLSIGNYRPFAMFTFNNSDALLYYGAEGSWIFRVAGLFALLLAFGIHSGRLAEDLMYWGRRLYRKPQSKPLVVPTVHVTGSVLPNSSSTDAIADMETELVVKQNTDDALTERVKIDPSELETELDLDQAQHRGNITPSKRVNIGTGIKIKPDADEMPDKKDVTESKRVNIGTGIKIDPISDQPTSSENRPDDDDKKG
ncbi:MAG: serine/threonine protein kinase [Chloroflexi bacterium]|nr:MAG: serine/threonine protein kinase [Chloroflexota bacterium]